MSKDLDFFLVLGLHGLRYYRAGLFLWFYHHRHILNLQRLTKNE